MADITGDNLRIYNTNIESLCNQVNWPVYIYQWVCLNMLKQLFFVFFLHERSTHLIPTTLSQLYHNCKESFCSHNLGLYVAPNRFQLLFFFLKNIYIPLYTLCINHFLMDQNLYGTNFLLTIIRLEFYRENERNLNPVCSHVKNQIIFTCAFDLYWL